MKKVILLSVILVWLLPNLFSCGEEINAYEALREFVLAYGAEGVIYSPEIEEGQEGYIPNGLIERIYNYWGEFPENYAVLLNSRTEDFFECGVFVCDDADSLLSIEEACRERIGLLTKGEGQGFIKISRMTVFYAVLEDRERAEEIWREIIR